MKQRTRKFTNVMNIHVSSTYRNRKNIKFHFFPRHLYKIPSKPTLVFLFLFSSIFFLNIEFQSRLIQMQKINFLKKITSRRKRDGNKPNIQIILNFTEYSFLHPHIFFSEKKICGMSIELLDARIA